MKFCLQDADVKDIRQKKGCNEVRSSGQWAIFSDNLNIELIVLCTDMPSKSVHTKVY